MACGSLWVRRTTLGRLDGRILVRLLVCSVIILRVVLRGGILLTLLVKLTLVLVSLVLCLTVLCVCLTALGRLAVVTAGRLLTLIILLAI